ncbi:hypothetical protein BN938_2153 [Mucinivorans hirudinis]|uniref:Uncharacterized protein n=1 Tax=Mucinivorans hirudinis TaxID=1433126 RepID=A0A060R9D0_9BACT|nr:hypothetical protein BN938_2153 [Mucinivorans hirudinis]
MVFVGCKKNTTAPPKDPTKKPVAAKFGGKILTNDVKATTRVTEDNKWEAGDFIGIYMVKEGSRLTKDVKLANYKFQSNDKGAFEEITGAIYFPSGGEKVDFVAYHPFNSSLSQTQHTQFVEFGPQYSLKDMECLWASATGRSEESPEVNFEFKRLQSSARIIIVHGREVDKPSSATITLTSMPVKAVLDAVDGTLEVRDDVADLVIKDNQLYYFPPHKAENFKLRSMIIEVGAKKVVAPLEIDFESGKTHKISVFLSEDGHKADVIATLEPFERSQITLKPTMRVEKKL